MYQWGILLVPVVSPGPSEALWFWPTRIVASEFSGKFISKHEKSFDYLCSRMTWDGRSKNERSLEQYRGIRTLYALLWPKLTIGSMPMLKPKKRTKLTAFFNFIVGHLTFCFQKLLMHAGLPRGGGRGGMGIAENDWYITMSAAVGCNRNLCAFLESPENFSARKI